MFRRWWSWRPVGLGPYETVRAWLMSRTLLVLVALAVASIPPQIVALGVPGVVGAAVTIGFSALYVAALSILWRGHQQRAATLFATMTIGAMVCVAPVFGGIHGATPIFMVADAMILALLLDPGRATVAVSVLLASIALSAVPMPFPPSIRGEALQLGFLVCTILAMGQVATFSGLTVDAMQAASEEAELRSQQAILATRAAQAAVESKARFLATMSHELRTPLNAILGYAGLLREEPGPSDPDLERIETAGTRLLALVEDVLELARVDATAADLSPEEVDLRQIVVEQLAALDLAAEIDGPDGPVIVRTDRSAVRKVVTILLNQRVRSRIAVTLLDRGDQVDLVICDADRTIPRAMLGRVFEPFVRLDPSSTGLGPALALRIAQQLGGGIGVTATGEHGSAFTLHLPKERR